MNSKAFISFSIVLLLLLLGIAPANAQVQKKALAQEYYKQGDYEKAVVLYEELYNEERNPQLYYRYYYNCLISLQEYKELEKMLRRTIKKQSNQQQYRVDLGYMFSQMGEEEKSIEEYEEAIQKVPAQRGSIIQLANSFSSINEFEYALMTFEKGRKLLRQRGILFNYELANLYAKKGDLPQMITAYFDYAEEEPSRVPTIKNALQRNLSSEKDFNELQEQLYVRIQKDPNTALWPELLIWNFLQLKEFPSAFIQVKALDKRMREPGTRVFNFAQTVQNSKEWDVAIDAYDYLIKKGPDNIYYYNARNNYINCQKEKILAAPDYTEEDLLRLKSAYLEFIEEYPRQDAKSAETNQDLAHLLAFYLYDQQAATIVLEEIVNWPGLRPAERSDIKLDLGDLYLMQGEIWDASLLYSQVDKQMKDEPLGEAARFYNARLSYFNGDFEWAQGQLNVLKSATTELVANDALNLSVFITENLGLDSSTTAMEMYSRAELLFFQNKADESLVVLDSIKKEFPGHVLTDDIVWKEANIEIKKRNWEKAASLLIFLDEQYGYDILADNALFTLGKLYSNQLYDKEKAMACFEKIMLEHKDSIYVVEARKRFRELRGDELN
ncbi:MAG: tetratricopeptide (TPR) repeat protein [Limisphaerales bacterium]|jgi:tetratricopeptide (TPR) repeat protein